MELSPLHSAYTHQSLHPQLLAWDRTISDRRGSTRFHDLRQTYASFLLSVGISPKVAAERIGMSPAMFNETYSHLLPTMQDDAISLIQKEIHEGRKNILNLFLQNKKSLTQ